MRRIIDLPQQVQNTPATTLSIHKQSPTYIHQLYEECILTEAKWRTNLMIPQQAERVFKRDRGPRKNTSFQSKIINDHVWVMVRVVCEKHQIPSIPQCRQIFQSEVRHDIIKNKRVNNGKQLLNGVIKTSIHDDIKLKLRQLSTVHKSKRSSNDPKNNE